MKSKTLFGSIRYMLHNWKEWDSKSIFIFILRVPALVLGPILTAYIPKAIIDCINKESSVKELTVTVALLSVGVALTTWLGPFLQELLSGSARVIRMRYAVKAFEKNLTADYMKIESLEGREKNKRAAEFYQSYYSAASYFIEALNQAAVCIIGVIASMALIYKINIFMILLILLTCVGEFFVLRFLNKREKSVKNERNAIFVKLDYYYELSRNCETAKDIRLYGFSDYLIKTYADLVSRLEQIVSKYTGQSASTGGVRAALNLLRETVAYAYLVYLVTAGKLGVSDFIFYFGIITGFSNWIMSFVYCYSNIERCCNDCEAYRSFVEPDDEKSNNGKKADFESVESIEFKNVTFRYPEADSDTIHKMSFTVKEGENIAIVGENGAGKTTAVKLLCGLYRPTEGEIRINGENVSDFSRESLFSLFAPVFQDSEFMPMTIAQNISAESDCNREKLYNAFEKAGIKDTILSLPEKENTPMIKDVFKDAAEFSGGEKQKLLLAKAIYKNAPVLILDEPTAALDPIAENELYLKYSEMTKGKISFFISHRLSSTRFCDRILFIKDGLIAESGTHDELMSKNSEYSRMFRIQSYYYRENGGDAV
ncbi:MAG: ABC transporter ATP-binding protein [Acutalibacteraceae bacterium]